MVQAVHEASNVLPSRHFMSRGGASVDPNCVYRPRLARDFVPGADYDGRCRMRAAWISVPGGSQIVESD